MTRLPLWLTGIALISLAGCDSADAASAQPAVSASGKAFDDAVYCHSVCERATSCGIEALEQTVKANAADVRVLNKARANAPNTTATCEDTCNVAPTDDQREAFVDAERCLEQTSCDAFASCLATVAKR